MSLNTGEYRESLGRVAKVISSARSNAAQKASAEMIRLYWLIGNELVAWRVRSGATNTSKLCRRTLGLHSPASGDSRSVVSSTWQSSLVRCILNCAIAVAQFRGAMWSNFSIRRIRARDASGIGRRSLKTGGHRLCLTTRLTCRSTSANSSLAR